MTQPSNSAPSSEPAPPTASDKPGRGNKVLEGIYDKLILGVIGGLVATLITNYISRQSHFDEVVSKYTAAVKEYTVSEKLSSLRASKDELEKDIKNLGDLIDKLNFSNSSSKKLDLKPEDIEGFIFGRTKKEVEDSEYVNYGVDPHNFGDFITCVNEGDKKCENFRLISKGPIKSNKAENSPKVVLESIEEPITSDKAKSSLKVVLENIKDRKESSLEEKTQAIDQIRGLAQSVTVNTLITLSEDSSFLGIAGWSNGLMDFIPFLRNKNLVRRDIVINTLRNSQLGFGSRYDGQSKFPYFLQNITIGSYTNQGGSLINLRQVDLSLGQFQSSNLTQLDLRGATLSDVQLDGARVSRSDLTGANLSNASLKNTVFIDSILEKVNMKQASLQGARFQTERQGSCREFEEKAGIKCYEGVNLKGANLSGTDLTNADLTGVDLTDAILTATNLTGAKGIDLDKLKKDSILCNTVLPDGAIYSNNCRSADFSRLEAKEKVFDHETEVNFSKANLAGAKFTKSISVKSTPLNFYYENIENTSPLFRETNLTRVEFIFPEDSLDTLLPKIDILIRKNKICYTKIGGLQFSPDQKAFKKNINLYKQHFLRGNIRDKSIFLTMDCAGEDLSNPQNDNSVNFSDFDLTGIDFSKANLTNVKFQKASLKNTNFNGANLTNADLTDATDVTAKRLSEQAVLCNTILPDGKPKSTNCKNADLSRQDLKGQSFENVDLTGADLTKADLTKAIFTNANLTKAILTNANLTNANLTNANLTEATGVTDESQAKARLCNTTLPDGKTKKSTNCKGADLSRKELKGQSFEDSDLTDAILTNANLTNANLTNAILTNANLTKANLTGATGVTLEQLKSAKAILCRTKLPDGSQDDSGCPQKSG